MKHLRCPPCGTVRVQGSRLCTRYQRRRSTRCGTCGAHRCGTVGVRGSRLRTRSSAHGGQAVSYAHRGPRQEWALGCVARLRACVACGHAGRYSARDSGAPRVLSVLSKIISRTHEQNYNSCWSGHLPRSDPWGVRSDTPVPDLGGEAGACVSEWEDPSTPTGGHRMQSGVCVTHDRREG